MNVIRKLAVLSVLLFAPVLYAQNSITVSISVTDLGGQAWLNGTYTANFVGPTNVTWPGGTVTRSFSGSLSATGTATQSLPNNNTITPSPTFWTFTVCPATGVSSGCFITASISITTPAQAVTITPPAISIPASSTNSPIGAYADAEITSNAFVGAVYNQITTTQVTQRICQAVSGNTCTAWAANGGGGGVTFPLLAPNGSASAPSYSFTNSTNSGLLFEPVGSGFAGLSAIGLVNGGLTLMDMNTTGVRITDNAVNTLFLNSAANAGIKAISANGVGLVSGNRFKIIDEGSCTMAAGTCSAQNFASTYTSAPLVFLTWNGTGTCTGLLKAPSTTTTTTPASSVGTDTCVVNWIAFGN